MSNTCGVISPDGRYGCTQICGHENPACGNPSGNVRWCGDCSKWTCHHVPPVTKTTDDTLTKVDSVL